MADRIKTPAQFVFLDRDGAIIEEKGYLSRIEDIAFLPGSEAAIARLNRAGFKVVVISNQSGVARGYFKAEFVKETHRVIQEHLQRHGAHLDAFYFCPHHPSDNCECRKPKTAMLQQAAADFGLALSGFMIGDRKSDLGAGSNAKLKTILVKTGYGEQTLTEGNVSADFIASDLPEAVDWILRGGLMD